MSMLLWTDGFWDVTVFALGLMVTAETQQMTGNWIECFSVLHMTKIFWSTQSSRNLDKSGPRTVWAQPKWFLQSRESETLFCSSGRSRSIYPNWWGDSMLGLPPTERCVVKHQRSLRTAALPQEGFLSLLCYMSCHFIGGKACHELWYSNLIGRKKVAIFMFLML